MIKQTQLPGVRNWYGDDIVGIQTELFKVLEGFFGDYGNYVVSGCQVVGSNIRSGIVSIADPVDGPQLAYYPGKNNVSQWPIYISLSKTTTNDTYEDGNNKPVQVTYSAVDSANIPGGNYLVIQQNGAATRIWDVVQNASRRFVTDALVTQWNQNIVQPGMMLYWPKAAAPNGWLECDNTFQAIAAYPNLFAQIGTTWGGDGQTNFRLPPSQGYFIRGWDHGAGVDPGRAFGSIQEDALKSHDHITHAQGRIPGQDGNSGFLSSSVDGRFSGGGKDIFGRDLSPDPNMRTSFTGDTETRPKNIALMLIIKY
ncbi:MAG TPA: tail fiber protein [Puia sp.]|nr:tail fiber protein [Puia sp.]